MISPIEEDLNKLMRDLVNNILDDSSFSIKADQDAPRPTGSYASVKTVSERSKGWEVSTLTDRLIDPDIDNNILGYREVMYSVIFYRDSHMDNARSVKIGLTRESSLDLLRSNDIGLISRSEVRDISVPLENGWEQRASLDVVLSFVGTDSEVIRSIQSVTINGEFQTRGKVIPITTEVQ